MQHYVAFGFMSFGIVSFGVMSFGLLSVYLTVYVQYLFPQMFINSSGDLHKDKTNRLQCLLHPKSFSISYRQWGGKYLQRERNSTQTSIHTSTPPQRDRCVLVHTAQFCLTQFSVHPVFQKTKIFLQIFVIFGWQNCNMLYPPSFRLLTVFLTD